MIYLVTTDPHRAPQEVEAPVARAAAVSQLDSIRGSQDSVTVYVRTVRASKWDVFSCIWNGTEWWTHYMQSEAVDHASEIESLRAQLSEEREIRARMRDLHDAERARWQETLRAERERAREACWAACEALNEASYHCPECGNSGYGECAETIAALDLDAIPENVTPR